MQILSYLCTKILNVFKSEAEGRGFKKFKILVHMQLYVSKTFWNFMYKVISIMYQDFQFLTHKLIYGSKFQALKLPNIMIVLQDVPTMEACRDLCLTAPYRCHSFDYGDTGERVCRLSHHTSTTLTQIQVHNKTKASNC